MWTVHTVSTMVTAGALKNSPMMTTSRMRRKMACTWSRLYLRSPSGCGAVVLGRGGVEVELVLLEAVGRACVVTVCAGPAVVV